MDFNVEINISNVKSGSSSSSSSSDSNQYWTTNRIWTAVAIGVFISAIIGGILYAIISNSASEKSDDIPEEENSTSQSANEPTSKTAQDSVLPAISYVKESGSYWDAGESGSYTCPNAVGVNTTGDNGNFADYCIFTGANAQGNAEKQCSLDSKCLGYSVGKLADGSAKVQLTASGPVASGGNNKYFQKM